MEAFITDPLLASAHMRALSERLLAFDQALSVGPVALDPFRGETTIGKTWREEVLASKDFEPIRGRMVAFIDRLLERRLNLGVSLEESAQLTQTQYAPEPPFGEPGTLAERRLLALSASADPSRKEDARSAWRRLALDAAGLSAVRVLRYERLIEIEGRLGARLTVPVSFDEEKVSVEGLARLVLESTADAAAAVGLTGWSGSVEGGTGFPAVEGWPARLGLDGLLDLLGGRWLLRDVNLAGVHMPLRLCPASFLRAAAHLGRDAFRATVPESLPFVLCRTPGETYGRAFGRLLALWLSSPACARRKLGLGPEARSRHARGAARLLVSEGRLLAARALLAEAGRHSRARLDQVWGDLGVDLYGESIGPPLGLFSAPPDAAVDLVAFLWALSKEAELIRACDEDYLDNPRAREVLLAELHAVEASPPAYAVLELAARGLSQLPAGGA